MSVINCDGTETYIGCVIKTWEHNGYDDSDWYANCINTETGKIDTVEYASTRYGGSGNAFVDITAENYALYLHNGGKINELTDAIITATYKAKEVTKGKEVIVKSGRKVPHGTIGNVFWTKEVNYDPYHRDWHTEIKIGIKDSEGNVYWTYEKNVEVLDYRKYIDTKEIRKAAKRSHSKNWLSLRKKN